MTSQRFLDEVRIMMSKEMQLNLKTNVSMRFCITYTRRILLMVSKHSKNTFYVKLKNLDGVPSRNGKFRRNDIIWLG